MRAWRARYGAAPSSYDWSRIHARRRGGEALKDYRPENGPRRPLSSICTAAGRRPAPTPSPAAERPGHNAVVAWTGALRLVICERGRRRSPHTPRPFVSVAATRPWAPVAAGSRGATASCACKPPRIGPRASTSTTLATTAKRVGGQVAHDASGGRRGDQLRKRRMGGAIPVRGPARIPSSAGMRRDAFV